MEIKGIDVSKWQGDIDWAEVCASGVRFAMIRALYGTEPDPRFEENVSGAVKNGVFAGAYVYSLASAPDEARAEAEALIALVRGHTLRYPAAIDFEDSRFEKLTKAERGGVISAFCETVKNAGLIPMLYSSRDWFDRVIPMSAIKKYPVWLGQWRDEKPEAGFDFAMWQSGAGSVPGISGEADIDFSYVDFAALTAPPLSFTLTSPRGRGEGYLAMQRALNACGYRDSNGKRLKEDGVWGKRSYEAFLSMVNAFRGTVSRSR